MTSAGCNSDMSYVEKTGLCQPPRISLSEGLVSMEPDSLEPASEQAQACGSTYSSDFEFFVSFGTVIPKTGCYSPSQSVCCADKIFSNGQILPLDQLQQKLTPSPEHKFQQLVISDGAGSEIGPADAPTSVSKRWTDVFKLKKSTYNDCPVSVNTKEKHVPPARSLWFLRRTRSTSDQSQDPNVPTDVSPWLGRSSSDSRINRFRPPERYSSSRRGSAKPTDKVLLEDFRSYHSQVLSRRNPCSNGKGNLRPISHKVVMIKGKTKDVRINNSSMRSCSGKRRASDCVDGRSGIDNGSPENHSHSQRSSKTLSASFSGTDISHKRKEIARLKMQKQHDFGRSPGSYTGSHQVAPVLHMQMCISHSFITSKVSRSRFAEFCHLNFQKKDKPQKQSLATAAATLVSIS